LGWSPMPGHGVATPQFSPTISVYRYASLLLPISPKCVLSVVPSVGLSLSDAQLDARWHALFEGQGRWVECAQPCWPERRFVLLELTCWRWILFAVWYVGCRVIRCVSGNWSSDLLSGILVVGLYGVSLGK
jgi:hypothetical protein